MSKKIFLKVGLTALTLCEFVSLPSVATETLPPQLLYQKNGATASDHLGFSVAGVGDVDGDGKVDFIVSTYRADPGGRTDAGSAYLYSGANGSLLYQKDGVAAGDQFGYSVGGAGDVNGDGKGDFIFGARFADPSGRTSAGSAYLYSGANGSLLYQKDGVAAGDQFGYSVGGAGDVNSDGKADFIVGAFLTSPGGSVYLYSGVTGLLLYQKDGAATSDWLGWSVAGAGDVNGDGKADFIVGARLADPGGRTDAGSAYIYSGATGLLLFQKDGIAADDQLGFSVATAGDVNADGKADFIAGAFNASPGGRFAAGSVYLYSGATGLLLFQKDGAASADQLGISVSGAGDLDADGKADFIVGAYLADPGGRFAAGSVYLYSGATGSLLYQIDGANAGDELGISVAGAGDVNGDGETDLIIGADHAAPGGISSAGSAYVYGLVPTDAPDEKQNRPNQFEISQNYPNPFNSTTTIHYYLPKRGKVTLEIFNLVGQHVKILANEEQAAGEHAIIWDGKDAKGKILPSGIYFYKLTAKDFTETKKMIFLK